MCLGQQDHQDEVWDVTFVREQTADYLSHRCRARDSALLFQFPSEHLGLSQLITEHRTE